MAKKTLFTYDKVSGRWRKAGKWSSPPRVAQLRADARGRPIDARGKLVPLAAIHVGPRSKPVPRAPKAPVKSREYVLDVKAGRWRKGGKFAPSPSIGQLRQDKAGRFIDGAGRRVKSELIGAPGKPVKRRKRPVKALEPAKPAKAPRARKRPEPPPTPAAPAPLPFAEFVPVGASITNKLLLSSRYSNRQPPTDAGNTLYYFMNKLLGPVEADDITLYKYGVQFISPGGKPGAITELQKIASNIAREIPGATVKYGEGSMHVMFGGAKTPVDRNEARADMQSKGDKLARYWAILADLWDGDIGWFAIAENDEVEY